MVDLTRTFSREDQSRFAELSGDVNPIHVDPVWALANFPGELVVHGVHTLLWVLDCTLAAAGGGRLAAIHATFVKPVLVGDVVTAAVRDEGRLLTLSVGGQPVLVVRARRSPEAVPDALTSPSNRQLRTAPRIRIPEELAGVTGDVAPSPQARGLTGMFPALSAAIGEIAMIGLSGLSVLVGMDCPGLRGMLSSIDVSLVGGRTAGHLAFAVRRYIAAISLVEMDVEGLGVIGHVAAFAGREYAPPSDHAIRAAVRPGEFKGASPLIVGASSGLGAVTARLLAAGGAEPVLTWHRTPGDLESVRASVRDLGGTSREVRLDATAPREGVATLQRAGWSGAQMYFFATPRIFRRRLAAYSPQDFRTFFSVYVEGFLELVEGLQAPHAESPLHCFYPSSIALEERTGDLLEYGMAKLAGEYLCATLTQKHRTLSITVVRLPRIDTRQTQAFARAAAASAEQTMAPIIRAVQSAKTEHA